MGNITPAAISDAQEILALQKLAYRSEASIYDDWSIPPLIETLPEIQEVLATTTVLKLTCDGGAIHGSVRGVRRADTCEIGRLIVHPEHRGKGSARA